MTPAASAAWALLLVSSLSAFPQKEAAQNKSVPPLERVVQMLREPITTRGLSIRVGARVLPGASPTTVDLVVVADIGRKTSPQDVTVGIILLEADGRVVDSGTQQRRLEPGLGPDGALRYTCLLQVPPGRYRLKMAAVDGAGQGGCVERDVQVSLAEVGPLMLGDILLTPAGASDLSLGLALDDTVPSGVVKASVQFRTKEAALPAGLRVTAEVADTAAGRALRSVPLSLGRAAGGELHAVGQMDLGLLPPGDYFVRAVVTVEGRAVGARTTPVRIVAAGPAAASLTEARPTARLSVGSDRWLIRPFDVKDVLRLEVVGFFVGRLASTVGPPPSNAVAGARQAVRTGEFEKARTELTSADDRWLDVRFLRGVALLAVQAWEPAAAEFRAALKVDSEFLPAAFYLGACYAAGGNDREAVGAWQMALVSESQAPIVYEVLVDALLRLREGQQAGEFMAEALERWPSDDTFRPRAAAVALAKGDARGALDLLDPHIEAHPGDVTSLFLAMRAIFQVRAEGKTARGESEDVAAMARYARLYEAAQGSEREIVARWLAFVQRREP
jgi:tetratricopeptide (TPR) repeat protein